MSPSFQCPNCSHALTIQEPLEGSVRGPCPSCGRTIEVTLDESSVIPSPRGRQVVSSPPPVRPSPPRARYYPVARWENMDLGEIPGRRGTEPTSLDPSGAGREEIRADAVPQERRIGQLLPKRFRRRGEGSVSSP